MSTLRKPRTKIVEPDVQTLGIKNLRICPEMLQVRAVTDMGVCKRYSEAKAAGSVFPPVLVYFDGEDHWLADGFHRVRAYEILGLREIKAVVRRGTVDDALLGAIEENGDDRVDRKLNDEDRKHAAEIMIRRFTNWSDNEISKRTGCNKGVVKIVRLRLKESEGILLPDRVLAFSNGKPNGKSTKYKPQPGTIRKLEHTTRHGGPRTSLHVRLDGDKFYLGSDERDAQKKLDIIREQRESARQALSSMSHLGEWLGSRRIISSGIPTFGGFRVDDAIIQAIADTTVDSYHSAFSRVLHARSAVGATRAILIGYVRSNAQITKFLPIAAKFGIKVMTPEELVAEFGPKGDGGPSGENAEATEELEASIKGEDPPP
jgi:hypothetical protein